MKFKLRAECSEDVANFISKSHSKLTSFSMQKWEGFPDVDFEFETDCSIEDIKSDLMELEDSHVMVETVKPINQYSGERFIEDHPATAQQAMHYAINPSQP